MNIIAEEINSSSNKSYKIFKSLISARGIKKNKLAIVSGEKNINELINKKKEIIKNIILPSSYKLLSLGTISLLSELSKFTGIKFIKLKNELFREIDIQGTKNPLLIVEIPEYKVFDAASFNENILPIIPFQDPVNVGAVVRAAAAFGIGEIMLLEEAAIPYHPKSIRASGVQVFNMDFFKGPSIYNIETIGIPLIVLSIAGKNINEFKFPEKFALLAGIEGPGIPDNLNPDYMVSIKIHPLVESLNAAISVSIALYEWRRRNPF